MADAAGGRGSHRSLVAAATLAAVVLFLTALRFLPLAALGAVLIKASVSLLDSSLRQLYRLDRTRPVFADRQHRRDLGGRGRGHLCGGRRGAAAVRAPHVDGRGSRSRHGRGLAGSAFDCPPCRREDDFGLALFRFNAPLVFFDAPYFRQQANATIHRAGPESKWFLLDALPITQVDVTGYAELEYLSETLRKQGAELALAGRSTESDEILRAKGMDDIRMVDRHFPTMRQAIKAYRSTHPAGRL